MLKILLSSEKKSLPDTGFEVNGSPMNYKWQKPGNLAMGRELTLERQMQGMIDETAVRKDMWETSQTDQAPCYTQAGTKWEQFLEQMAICPSRLESQLVGVTERTRKTALNYPASHKYFSLNERRLLQLATAR